MGEQTLLHFFVSAQKILSEAQPLGLQARLRLDRTVKSAACVRFILMSVLFATILLGYYPVPETHMIARHQSVLLVSVLIAACADPVAPPVPAPESSAQARGAGGKPGIVITDLGTLGGNQSRVMGVNTPTDGRGLLIVGQSDISSGGVRPAYWYVDLLTGEKSVKELGLPPGVSVPTGVGDAVDHFDYRGGFSFDANSKEQIVGYGARYKNGTYHSQHAFIWSGPAAAPTIIPGLENRSALAGAINEDGDAVGYLVPGTTEESVFFFDGVATTYLETLGGPGEPRDVNNHGVVVGVSRESPTGPFSSQRGFVSSPGGPPLKLPDLGGMSGALAINDAGTVVGYAYNAAGESRAVRWTGSLASGYVIEDLGLTRARAWDINSSGEIVGSFVNRQGERGFFRATDGTTKVLPILGYAGIAYALNENAQIVGISWFQSKYSHAVLWTGVR